MTSDTILDTQQQIVSDFELLGDWQQRYAYVIDLGKNLIGQSDSELQTEENRLYGCQSNVWLSFEYKDQKLFFTGTSDSVIVAGLMALLFKVYSGQTPKAILSHSLTFLNDTGLVNNLTSQRSTGLAYMVERIYETAQSQQGKSTFHHEKV